MTEKQDWQQGVREIVRHQVGDINSKIEITAAPDTHGRGGGCHQYRVSHVREGHVMGLANVKFHMGGMTGDSPNGVTDEALLCILIDRLERFQRGELGNRHNALALTKLEEALLWLQERTRDRQRRGVEGKYQP